MRVPEQSAPNAGFTLIEVIISFIILAMVLGSVTVSLSYSARLHRASEAKQLAVGCAEFVIAEKFRKVPSLPSTESGGHGSACRWRIVRRVAKAAFTESARNLVAFRLEILGPQEQLIDAFETYYIESLP